jgi:hypothetical protein
MSPRPRTTCASGDGGVVPAGRVPRLIDGTNTRSADRHIAARTSNVSSATPPTSSFSSERRQRDSNAALTTAQAIDRRPIWASATIDS